MIKITIEITSETGEQAQKELAAFATNPLQMKIVEYSQEVIPAKTAEVASQEEKPAPAEKPVARSRAKAATVTPEVAPETFKAVENVPAQETADHSNETIAATAPSNDLLDTPSSPPANSLLDTPAVAKPLVATGVPTFEELRHKVGAHNNKQGIRDLIKNSYTKADGTPCFGPSDLQEKDWADFYAKLDTL